MQSSQEYLPSYTFRILYLSFRGLMGTLGGFHLILDYCYLLTMTLAEMYIIFPTFNNWSMYVTAVFTVLITWLLYPTWYTKKLWLCFWTPMINRDSLHLDKPHRHSTYYSYYGTGGHNCISNVSRKYKVVKW